MTPLKVLKTASEMATYEDHIRRLFLERGPLNILEAGCGRFWPIKLDNVNYKLTGVDLNEKSLELRKSKQKDLDEIIAGDLRTVELNNDQFDVIYNSFVLEHIQNAEHVLDNFDRWLKPGGLLILRIPDRDSVYGFVTRFSPFWFHVFYKKYIKGHKLAGTPGYGPFPTFHEPVVSRHGIHKYCVKHKYIIQEELGTNDLRELRSTTNSLINSFSDAVAMLSLGKLSAQHINLGYVLKKQQG